MDKLLPCPFCEGEADMIVAKKFKQKSLWLTGAEPPDEYNCWVKCKKCHTVYGAVEFPTETEAAAAWNRRTQPENKPLTLEQLKQMDDQPVWTTTNGVEGSGRWELIKYNILGVCPLYAVLTLCNLVDGETDYDIESYGKTWLAYRYKLERTEK